MFARTAAFVTLALPILAVATPVELEARQTCSTGAIQCCNSVQSVSTARAGEEYAFLTHGDVPTVELRVGVVPLGLARHRCRGHHRPGRLGLLAAHGRGRRLRQCLLGERRLLHQQQRCKSSRHHDVKALPIAHAPCAGRLDLHRMCSGFALGGVIWIAKASLA